MIFINTGRYNNYHRHDHYSNIRTPDVIVKPEDYINRAKELGHTTYFTTNHGCSGNVFEAYDLCKKNNLKCIYGMEMYYADDRHIKEGRNNYHIVVIGLTKNAYYHINRISSEANKTGFYYHPRVDMELLLTLPSDEVVVTTACIAGRLFKTDNYIEEFVLPLKEHFGGNFMLETQSHVHEAQAKWNKKVLELSNEYDIPIIHGNDSHYIYPDDAKKRSMFLKGKGMRYGDEDSFILDYPDYQTIVARYEKQGVLPQDKIKEALENTLIFDKAKDLNFNKDIKMPSIYPNTDKNLELKKILADKWKAEKKYIAKNQYKKYQKEIEFEMDIIENTKMADYFLLNEKIIDKAVNEYGAVLTKSGRGSAPSYYTNKLLKFTDIDRINAPVPLYATRFMSLSRILETGSLPDIDYNFANIDPAVKASKDILGEDGVYFMVAYGTMQESAAFRNLCRAYKDDMEFSKQRDENGKTLKSTFNRKIDEKIKKFNFEYNEVAKDLDYYRDDDKWKDMIEQSKSFIGVIDSIAPSPCSFLLLDKSISEEIGLVRVGDEICAAIDGYTSDTWKYLKNDYLTVSVWAIISETFKLINKPIPSIKELENLLDDNVWNLYKNGVTATMNQVDSDFATNLVKKYKPTSVAELSAFVASIRPGFASLLNNFIERKSYTTGIEELDDVLKDSFHYMLYQESIMKFLVWCGIHEDETYGIIKKISKKKFKEEELEDLKGKLLDGFKKKTDEVDKFDEVWQVIEDASHYAFNASHSLSVAYDSLYGGYLKANYPLEYYTVVLNHFQGDSDKTNKIISEFNYFNIKLKPIKFGYSHGEYTFDKETNSIYKGISSIKYINKNTASELYKLRDNKYDTFYNLLVDITENTDVGKAQIQILSKLNFFDMFANNKKILDFIDLFYEIYNKKQLSMKKVEKLNLDKDIVSRHSQLSDTGKTYMNINYKNILVDMWDLLEDKKMSLGDQIEEEIKYLGYIDFKEPRASLDFYVVSSFKTYNDKRKPYITLYQLKTGKTIRTKVTAPRYFEINPFKLYSILKVKDFKWQKKWKNPKEKEQILVEWEVF